MILALLRFIRLVSRPRVEVLGEVEGFPGFHSVARHEGAKGLPGILLFATMRRSPFSMLPISSGSCFAPLKMQSPVFVMWSSICFQ